MPKEQREGSILSKKSNISPFLGEYLGQLVDMGEDELLFDQPVAVAEEKSECSRCMGAIDDALAAIAEEIRRCRSCALSKSRTLAVPGSGNARSGVILVGEAPGGQEDRRGLPFVGASGQFLRRLLKLAGIGEEDYFLLNVIKCRPPGNRDPAQEELEACRRFTEEQLDVLQPRLLVGLGRYAGRYLLNEENTSLGRMRETSHKRNGVPVIVTYHPSALLRQSSVRAQAWQDFKRIRRVMDSMVDDRSN